MAETWTVEWCLYCESEFVVELARPCPRVCDGGQHEPHRLTADETVRPGFSVHEARCPLHNPSPRLPAGLPCACRRNLTQRLARVGGL